MRIVNIDINKPDKTIIKTVTNVLLTGGIIVYPTDTAYGIGVDAFNTQAIKKLYELKGRDLAKPTHVVVRDWNMIEELAYTNDFAKKLYDKFLPGPLTMVLKKKDSVPNILVANGKTVGVRIPKCKFTLSLSQVFPNPYTTPSANRSGEKTPYDIEEVSKVLDLSKVDLVIDGGKLPKVIPSTVVDMTNEEIKILREGPISNVEIQDTLI